LVRIFCRLFHAAGLGIWPNVKLGMKGNKVDINEEEKK